MSKHSLWLQPQLTFLAVLQAAGQGVGTSLRECWYLTNFSPFAPLHNLPHPALDPPLHVSAIRGHTEICNSSCY